jgi:hypothetical protein
LAHVRNEHDLFEALELTADGVDLMHVSIRSPSWKALADVDHLAWGQCPTIYEDNVA